MWCIIHSMYHVTYASSCIGWMMHRIQHVSYKSCNVCNEHQMHLTLYAFYIKCIMYRIHHASYVACIICVVHHHSLFTSYKNYICILLCTLNFENTLRMGQHTKMASNLLKWKRISLSNNDFKALCTLFFIIHE